MARELTAHRDRLAVAGAERYSGFANGHSVTFTSSYVESDSHALDFTLSMALVEADEEFKSSLRSKGFLTRDPRKKERKKYGQPGARKKYQYSKR